MARAEEETGTQRCQKMGQGEMGLSMLGRKQVTPRWANDPMLLQDGSRWESDQGRVRAPPPEGNQVEGGDVPASDSDPSVPRLHR